MAVDYKPLCRAIASGDLDGLSAAIRRDSAAATHWKPIVDAAFAGRADMLRVLLDAGADPNVQSGTGSRHTPLTRLTQHHATIPKHDGHAEALKTLLQAGADPDLRAGPLRLAPLAYAAMAPAPHFIELLSDTRIDIHLAAALLDATRLRRALRDPERVHAQDPAGRTPLQYVALSGLWKEHGSERALRCATLLLDAGADVNNAELMREGDEVFRATALWRTLSAQQHYALAECLLERGADPNPAVFTVTFSAASQGCELLDRYGANWEQTFHGRTPLMDLMYFKKPAGSRWLIARGVQVGAVDPGGKTALHFAAIRGVRADYVQNLIDAGANVDAKDHDGNTALDYARAHKRDKLIALLRP